MIFLGVFNALLAVLNFSLYMGRHLFINLLAAIFCSIASVFCIVAGTV